MHAPLFVVIQLICRPKGVLVGGGEQERCMNSCCTHHNISTHSRSHSHSHPQMRHLYSSPASPPPATAIVFAASVTARSIAAVGSAYATGIPPPPPPPPPPPSSNSASPSSPSCFVFFFLFPLLPPPPPLPPPAPRRLRQNSTRMQINMAV